MITKIAIAALVTFGGAAPAFAADNVERNGDTYVMHFAPFDVASTADRDRVVKGVKATARKVCRGEGDVMDARRCERPFTHHALAAIERPNQRTALLDRFFGRDSSGASAAMSTIAPE